ncbi:hypothetical protein FRC12_017066 [Ceratobasidium sp. 428]|nr:hypothetical protein FRC12_017066 [Ceratobasidium sp. 428]
MSEITEDFDDYIDSITSVIGEIQRLSRKFAVQKAQCSKLIVLCHEVVNKLREAEEDSDVKAAMDRCNELIEEFRSKPAQWSRKLGTEAQGLSLLLVPIIDNDVRIFVDKLLDYTQAFPSIFAGVQRQKWFTDLEKSRLRDSNTNKSQLQALVDDQDDVLISALESNGSRAALQTMAREFGLLEDLNSITPPDNDDPAETNQSPRTAVSSPQDTNSLTAHTVQPAGNPSDIPHRSPQLKQGSLDAIWNTISKLEEHVGGDPAFEAQMEQLRKLAQAAMISTDEAVTGQARPNLLKSTAVIQSPTTQGQARPSLKVVLPSIKADLSVAQFAQATYQIPPEPRLPSGSVQNTHVLEFIKRYPSSNRFRLCTDISQGLAHMHAVGVVLGDFAPWNVTVDEFGNVRLRELNLSNSNGRPGRGTWRSQLPDARYIPPEVITLPPEQEGGTDPNPRKSDVYAFTLLLYEILSGVAPWDKLDIPSIVSQVTRGNRPTRPSPSIWLDNDNLWTLLQLGWHQQPESRPDMFSYAHNLEHWQQVLPKAQDGHNPEVLQQPPTPIANSFPFAKKMNDLCIMDDISFDISREVKMVSSLYAPFAHGGFCDIFIGRRGLEKVAMKRLRIVTIGDEDVVRKRFIRECEVWRKLKHPHVLEFYGIVKHGGSLFMISPFLDDGDAPSWLQNRCGDRLRVLLEAARGCLYLHTLSPKPTVHGDIKGANILIKSDGQAVLADFGLSKTMNAHTSHGLKDTGTGPYMAPELFAHCNDPEIEIDATTVPITKTLETDVFAFGRTAIELLSGQTPFGNAAATPAIWYMLLQGKRPARPNTPAAERWITDSMWIFINEMTHVQPACRPTMQEVVTRLERFCLELDPGCEEEVNAETEEEDHCASSIETKGDAKDDDSAEEEEDSSLTQDLHVRREPRVSLFPGPLAKGILKPVSPSLAPPKPALVTSKSARIVQFANDPVTSSE